MILKIWFWFKRIYKRLHNILTLSRSNPGISDSQVSIDIINDKIKLLKGTNKEAINLPAYDKYFSFLEKLGLREEFTIYTTQDNLLLQGVSIRPILINKNNQKIVVFCHGVTNNRWSLFYTMHLALQMGYQVITYDARNHGLSAKSYTTLGQIEASDLQDIINYARGKYRPTKIGLYGFSMGAATCLFWTSYFAGGDNPEVVFAICEAPFDNVSHRLKKAEGSGINYYWKSFLLSKLIRETLNTTRKELEKVNPLFFLPQQIPIKLLLLHGLSDVVIDWRASFKLAYQLKKNKLNKKKVNLYLFQHADHGEVPFIGDHIPGSCRWKRRQQLSQFNFTTLFGSYLRKNL